MTAKPMTAAAKQGKASINSRPSAQVSAHTSGSLFSEDVLERAEQKVYPDAEAKPVAEEDKAPVRSEKRRDTSAERDERQAPSPVPRSSARFFLPPCQTENNSPIRRASASATARWPSGSR